MAAVAPPTPAPQPNPYSTSQLTASLPQYQTQTQTIAAHDPLLESLKQYITTGQNAEHITTSELQQIFEGATSGGRSVLETFLSSCHSDRMPVWDSVMSMKGRISMSKILFEFSLKVQEIGIPYVVSGTGLKIFRPWSGEVDGKLYYHDHSALVTSDTFEAEKDLMGHFTIKFKKNAVHVGTFVTSSETLPLPCGPVLGDCHWAQ